MDDFPHALSVVALVAATLEYAILMRHREERRDALRWQFEVRDSLLSARRFTDQPPPVRRWTNGTRFRVER
jgi:hypothetical protein